MLSDAGITRLLAEMDNEPDATCARLGCGYPAPLGPYCGLHTGMELRSRSAPMTPGKPESERPRDGRGAWGKA